MYAFCRWETRRDSTGRHRRKSGYWNTSVSRIRTIPATSYICSTTSASGNSNIDSASLHWVRIRIQHLRLNANQDPGFWWPKNVKNLLLKKNNILLIKNCNLPIPRPPESTSKLPENPSALTKEHPALQNTKFLNFFLVLWVILPSLNRIRMDSESGWIPNPDPLTWFNPDPIRIRNTGLTWKRCCGSGSTKAKMVPKTVKN